MSWAVASLIAFAFLLYFLFHQCPNVCETCESLKRRQLDKPVRTAIDLRSEDEQRRRPRTRSQGTMTLVPDTPPAAGPGLNILHQRPRFYPNERNLPFKSDVFRTYMQVCTEFAIDYLGDNEQMCRVTEDLTPGFLLSRFPATVPEQPEKFSQILEDIYTHIIPGLTHWQHPRFMAYFPHGCSYPDMLAEFLIAAIGVVQFSWDSSPAFTELEILMVNWLGKAMGLPDDFLFDLQAPDLSTGGGAFQSSASDAIFTALLAARERKLSQLVPSEELDPDFRNKRAHFLPKLVVYASTEAHSAIEKAAHLAMVRLHPVDTDADYAMRGGRLEYEILKDLERGLIPFFVHATAGTTSVGSFDNLSEICDVASIFDLWVHVDGAYGAGALICPEFRYLMLGLERADSVNVNAHKLLLTSCTCSILWTRKQKAIRQAFSINGAYLHRTQKDAMDFRHWGVSLSRPAKALKLWLVFRLYGLRGLQDHIRRLTRLTQRLLEYVIKADRIMCVHNSLTLIAVRVVSRNIVRGNRLTVALCEYVNHSRQLLLTHARVKKFDVIRLSLCHERSTEADVDRSWKILKKLMDEFFASDLATQLKEAPLPPDDDDEMGDGFDFDENMVATTQTVETTESSSSSSGSSTSHGTNSANESSSNNNSSSLPLHAF